MNVIKENTPKIGVNRYVLSSKTSLKRIITLCWFNASGDYCISLLFDFDIVITNVCESTIFYAETDTLGKKMVRH